MITKEQAISLTYRDTIYHVRAKNADGSPMRARVNGAIKLWKTRPLEFRLPIARTVRAWLPGRSQRGKLEFDAMKTYEPIFPSYEAPSEYIDHWREDEAMLEELRAAAEEVEEA